MLDLRITGAGDLPQNIVEHHPEEFITIRQVLTDYRRISVVLRDFMLQHQERVFRSQGRHIGDSWDYSGEPLYKAWKKYQGASVDHVMRWKGGGAAEVLYPSLTNKRHPKQIWRRPTQKRAVFGTSVRYAERLARKGVNKFGEPRPARPTLIIRPQHADMAKHEVKEMFEVQLIRKGVIDRV